MSGSDLHSTVDDEPGTSGRGAARPSPARERYAVGEEIARGGTGLVSRAHDRQLEREVAIKSLLDPSAHHELRFAREARVTARLQHPSIVPIYDIGRLVDGQPYYAMKLVSGRTLDEAIRGARTLEERLALLPALIGVADAIAYAHAQHVIHRDLKPHNVVLGPFGESLVIDWGLAKQLDAPSITEEHVGEAESDDPALTVEGAVLGTPTYMPPEQARGTAVDERADVYALGAMLYHLLAGRPPYRGPSSRAVLVEVLEGPPPPLVELVPAVPADLVAIVDKAMARAPHDRYADAQQLVVDLRRFQTGQLVGAHHYTPWSHLRRFVRRHAAAVVVALVLGATLLVGATVAVLQIIERNQIADEQRKAAEAARGLADAQRDAAEELAGFMLDDLRTRLEPIGRLDLLRGVGDRVQTYYAALGAAGIAQDQAGERRRGQALALVGEAELDAGQLDEALETLTQVHAIAVALGDLALVARASERIALVHRRLGARAQAKAWLVAAIAAAEDAGELEIASRAQLMLASVLGDEGNWEDAYVESEHALALAHDLHDLDADTHQIDVAHALLWTGIHGRAIGVPEVSALLREARAYMLDALDDNPYDTRALLELVRVDDKVVRLDFHAADARMITGEACELVRRLRAIDPTNLEFLRAQLAALETDGVARGLAGDTRGGMAGFHEALATARLAAELEPDNLEAQRTVPYMLNRVGDAQYIAQDVVAATASYRAALDELVRLEARTPTPSGQQDLVHLHYDLGGALDLLGRRREAMAEYDAAIASGDALLRDGENVDVASWVAMASIASAQLVGRQDREQGRRRAARAIDLLERMSARSEEMEVALHEARALLQ